LLLPVLPRAHEQALNAAESAGPGQIAGSVVQVSLAARPLLRCVRSLATARAAHGRDAARVQRRTRIEQHSHDLLIASPRTNREGAHVEIVEGVNVRSEIDQNAHAPRTVVERGQVKQRGPAVRRMPLARPEQRVVVQVVSQPLHGIAATDCRGENKIRDGVSSATRRVYDVFNPMGRVQLFHLRTCVRQLVQQQRAQFLLTL
jgi:hypothetical protein